MIPAATASAAAHAEGAFAGVASGGSMNASAGSSTTGVVVAVSILIVDFGIRSESTTSK